jgi:hypothetical protein
MLPGSRPCMLATVPRKPHTITAGWRFGTDRIEIGEDHIENTTSNSSSIVAVYTTIV